MAVVKVPADFAPSLLAGILFNFREHFDWMRDAECANYDLAEIDRLFFPERSGSHAESVKNLAKARAICAACPVRWPCLNYALAIESPPYKDMRRSKVSKGPTEIIVTKRTKPVGMYGGHTAQERIAVLKRPRTEQLAALAKLWERVKPPEETVPKGSVAEIVFDALEVSLDPSA